MNVLVDTSVWSLALRRRKADVEDDDYAIYAMELRELINEMRAQIIGPIRQGILSGISDQAQFNTLKAHLKPFPDITINSEDYEVAAEFFNHCRKNGVQGSHIDFLICAVARQNNIPIFTTDKDFTLFAQHIDIALHVPRGRSRQ